MNVYQKMRNKILHLLISMLSERAIEEIWVKLTENLKLRGLKLRGLRQNKKERDLDEIEIPTHMGRTHAISKPEQKF